MLETLSNYSKVDVITAKVISKSRVIQTNKGSYQICTIKDVTGNTASLNLYSKFIDCLEPFKVCTFKSLHKAEVTKGDLSSMRLHTTNFTEIQDGSFEDKIRFQNISNGDKSEIGEILGFGEI